MRRRGRAAAAAAARGGGGGGGGGGSSSSSSSSAGGGEDLQSKVDRLDVQFAAVSGKLDAMNETMEKLLALAGGGAPLPAPASPGKGSSSDRGANKSGGLSGGLFSPKLLA